MHFVDRNLAINAPILKLEEFKVRDQKAWIDYNKARANKTKPLPNRPESGWLIDEIRTPLKLLFLKNCGYCGTFTDIGNDAEVDHFHPTSLDLEASYIYDWSNYIWSCPSCNRKKNSNFPLINPCSRIETDFVYFNESSGKYYIKNNASKIIKDKFSFTDLYTYINDKNKPDKRYYIFKNVYHLHLNLIDKYNQSLELERSLNGETTIEFQELKDKINHETRKILEIIRCGDHLLLIKYAINLYNKKNKNILPFSFEQLLKEAGFIAN